MKWWQNNNWYVLSSEYKPVTYMHPFFKSYVKVATGGEKALPKEDAV